MPQIQRILVPTDFSACSRAALDLAAELASRLGAKLTLLHAYALPTYPLPEGAVLVTPQQAAEIVGAASKGVHDELEHARARGADADSQIVEGDAFDVIERVVRDEGYDLVVMGTHGRRGVAHLLLGSVAEKVVRRGPCPVLTVRAPG